MDKEVLRKQIMVSQFVNAVGCPPDQATQFLQAAQWQWDVSFCLYKAKSFKFPSRFSGKLVCGYWVVGYVRFLN